MCVCSIGDVLYRLFEKGFYKLYSKHTTEPRPSREPISTVDMVKIGSINSNKSRFDVVL